jgi:enoyl-[acyl-carrier protein] reductase I
MQLGGKTGIIFGVANKRSIAWGIVKACADAGAKLALNYLDDRLERNVRDLAAALEGTPSGVPFCAKCDATKDDETDRFFQQAGEALGGRLDFLVHCIAFANREDLEGEFAKTSRAGFHLALDVSAYSLAALARRAAPLMTNGGSIITLTYLGSTRVFPNYNIMGVAKAALEAEVRYLAADLGPKKIRVNAISAGPIQTLSARGISGFTDILGHYAARAPLRRNTEIEEVADAALFLLAPQGRGVTANVLFVDCGYNVMGM